MKKIIIAISVCVSLIFAFSSCRKAAADPTLSYIKDFYGVNIKHSFICLNPTDNQKSLQVDLVWDEKGVATYTTKEIPRDTVNEHNSRLFMPASEFDQKDGTVIPTKPVRTLMLVYNNGAPEVVENYNCNGIWTWTCSNCGYGDGDAHVITQGLNSWVVCGISTNPYCYAHWYCQEIAKEYNVIIGWQSN